MLPLRELAVLEEARVAVAFSEIAPECRILPPELGSGVIARGVPGTWVNGAVGLGMTGPVPARLVDDVIEFHASVGAEPRVELCPFADPSLIESLAARGFVVRLFENVLFRELTPTDECRTPYPVPETLVIRIVDPADDELVHASAMVVASAFAGDRPPSDAALALAKECMRHKRSVTLAACMGERVVGAGSMELSGSVAALFGLCVDPAFRRRGIQLALMSERLTLAARSGAAVATIGARPGVSTEGNSRRMGFQVGYTKAAVVRPAEGLASVVG